MLKYFVPGWQKPRRILLFRPKDALYKKNKIGDSAGMRRVTPTKLYRRAVSRKRACTLLLRNLLYENPY